MATDDAWRRHANCTDLDPALFFPEGQGGAAVPEAAKAACAEHALVTNERFGVWGGSNERDRRRRRRENRLTA